MPKRKGTDGPRSDREKPRRGKNAKRAPRDGDVMRGRSFAGTSIANTELGQTRDRQRVVRGEVPDEAGEFVTDAEVEERDSRRAERGED